MACSCRRCPDFKKKANTVIHIDLTSASPTMSDIFSRYTDLHSCVLEPGQLFWDFYNKWDRCFEAYTKAAGAQGEALKCVTFMQSLGQPFLPWISTLTSTKRIGDVGTGPSVSFKDLRNAAREQWYVLWTAEEAREQKEREESQAAHVASMERSRAERAAERDKLRESRIRLDAEMERRRMDRAESDRAHAETMAERARVHAEKMAESNRVHAEEMAERAAERARKDRAHAIEMENERVKRDPECHIRAAKRGRKRARRAARNRTRATRMEITPAERNTARDTRIHAHARDTTERPQAGVLPRQYPAAGVVPAATSVITEPEAAKPRYGFGALKQDLDALKHELEALLDATRGAVDASRPDFSPSEYAYEAPDIVTE
nr:hypothetical protein B0A51_00183 [Rachicladosporium sp. CCFEE 5018]